MTEELIEESAIKMYSKVKILVLIEEAVVKLMDYSKVKISVLIEEAAVKLMDYSKVKISVLIEAMIVHFEKLLARI
jgi:hypothetical protein